MARRATWIVLLALLLAPILGDGGVPVFAQDGNGDESATPVGVSTSSDESADETADETAAEPTETPTLEPTATPTEEAIPTEEPAPTQEPTATSEPSPTATTKPTKTPTETPPKATATKQPTGTATPAEDTKVQAQEATATKTATKTAATTTADLKVTLSCRTDPEKITITNNGPAAIAVRSIGSTYKPTSAEPFAVSVKVSPGKSKIFRAGPNATGDFVLSKQLIFTNSVWDQEGVSIVTNVGTITRKCPAAPPLTKDQIKIKVNCTSDPETISITNNGELPLTVKSITTLYSPTPQEPFVMRRTVNP
ncbi:MAG TPA: hypothetical protein VKB09_12540, partial [Thermomicrobiales bacterium]|nr:hypothetical protein [Thermomicrobiales bacterium]